MPEYKIESFYSGAVHTVFFFSSWAINSLLSLLSSHFKMASGTAGTQELVQGHQALSFYKGEWCGRYHTSAVLFTTFL